MNRAATFLDDEDCAVYLQALAFASCEHRVEVHAYVLMSNHVHLVVGATQASAVSRMMKSVGRSHVRRFNARHRRTDTLWEGRFNCLAGSDEYLLACLRCIEPNPVRAAMVAWRWEH